jgi:hypothetical protein
MILTPYQIAVPLVSLVAVLYAWNLALRHKKTIWEALLWTIFWGGVAFIALEPGVLTYLSVITGVKSQANAFFATAIGILFFFMFYMIVRMEELNQRQSKLVRMMALKAADLDHKGEKQQNAK